MEIGHREKKHPSLMLSLVSESRKDQWLKSRHQVQAFVALRHATVQLRHTCLVRSVFAGKSTRDTSSCCSAHCDKVARQVRQALFFKRGVIGGVARHPHDISKIAELCCDIVCATPCSTVGHSNGVTLRSKLIRSTHSIGIQKPAAQRQSLRTFIRASAYQAPSYTTQPPMRRLSNWRGIVIKLRAHVHWQSSCRQIMQKHCG